MTGGDGGGQQGSFSHADIMLVVGELKGQLAALQASVTKNGQQISSGGLNKTAEERISQIERVMASRKEMSDALRELTNAFSGAINDMHQDLDRESSKIREDLTDFARRTNKLEAEVAKWAGISIAASFALPIIVTVGLGVFGYFVNSGRSPSSMGGRSGIERFLLPKPRGHSNPFYTGLGYAQWEADAIIVAPFRRLNYETTAEADSN